MANTCVIETKGVGGTLSPLYSDETITERFLVTLDTASRNLPAILNSARAANPTQFPLRGQSWPLNPGYGLYAKKFDFEMRSDMGKQWAINVSYLPLEPNEPNTEGSNDNPLLWPATYAVDWVEYEEAITKARNVEALGGSTSGAPRAANTLGPVVNGALQEFDEGIFEVVRDPVISITRNVATLDQVLSIESTYSRTTNSDTVYGVGPRRYKYLGVESGGVQTANGISYYTRTVRVQITKTTDRILNNVGWHFWYDDDGTKKLARFTVDDDDTKEKVPASEPGFLLRTGNKSTTPETVTYRHLEEVAYAGLLI